MARKKKKETLTVEDIFAWNFLHIRIFAVRVSHISLSLFSCQLSDDKDTEMPPNIFSLLIKQPTDPLNCYSLYTYMVVLKYQHLE